MLTIAIVDDDIKDLDFTWKMVLAYLKERTEYEVCVRRFQSSYDLLESVDAKGSFNIYIMDIMMPVLDGIEVGKTIRQKDGSAAILYLTNSQDYAYYAYRVKAHAYLLKPVVKEELFSALDEILDRLSMKETKNFIINNRKETRSLSFSSLLYVEYYNHRLRCHLTDGAIVESSQYRASFDEVTAPLTCDRRFVKISSSHIVNIQYVMSISKNIFKMADGASLNITRTYVGARKKYFDYIMERGF